MGRRAKPPDPDAPRLFDAPLFGPGRVEPDAVPAEPEESSPATEAEEAGTGSLPLFEQLEAPPVAEPAIPEAEPERAEVLAASSEEPLDQPFEAAEDVFEPEPRLSLGRRIAGGMVDLAIHLVALGSALMGQAWLGVPPTWSHAAPLALFLMAFSFLYSTVPLAFWGQTPGMASASLIAHNQGGHNLTFGQTLLRWLGTLATATLLGLPVLLAGKGEGRSLADRVSGSRTSLLAP